MSKTPFRPLPSGPPDLPSLESQVLARWHETSVFDRSMAQTADGPSWVFYEGPPTANGKPGAHHVEARNLSASQPVKLLAVFVLDSNDKPLTRRDKE